MNKKIVTLIGALVILTGGSYVALNIDDPISDIKKINFEEVVIEVKGLEFATSTDEDGEVTKTGIRIPIQYNFPSVTDTGFTVKERNEYIEMNFGAYNMCRQNGKTAPVCEQELKDDIQQNLETRQKNIERELEEFKSQIFQEEIIIGNL